MRTEQVVVVAVLAAGIGALIVPALAQGSGFMGDLGRGMVPGGWMSATMGGGCGGRMSFNNGAGRPNRQWQARPPGDATVG
jgi:hypothetical protein